MGLPTHSPTMVTPLMAEMGRELYPPWGRPLLTGSGWDQIKDNLPSRAEMVWKDALRHHPDDLFAMVPFRYCEGRVVPLMIEIATDPCEPWVVYEMGAAIAANGMFDRMVACTTNLFAVDMPKDPNTTVLKELCEVGLCYFALPFMNGLVDACTTIDAYIAARAAITKLAQSTLVNSRCANDSWPDLVCRWLLLGVRAGDEIREYIDGWGDYEQFAQFDDLKPDAPQFCRALVVFQKALDHGFDGPVVRYVLLPNATSYKTPAEKLRWLLGMGHRAPRGFEAWCRVHADALWHVAPMLRVLATTKVPKSLHYRLKLYDDDSIVRRSVVQVMLSANRLRFTDTSLPTEMWLVIVAFVMPPPPQSGFFELL